MLVTDKQYFMEDKLVKKLDLMIKRMRGTDDNVLIIDGDEGQGKTEFAFGICYYVHYNMGRSYNIKDNVFFDLEEGIKFASSTEDQIIHFDEGALGLLTTNWHNKIQQQFTQLVMTARKKRHFIVICIPKFHRLAKYVIEDRSIGLVHIYSRQNLEKGRFCYFRKESKERLYDFWRKTGSKAYKKLYDFHGTFPEVSKVIFTSEQIKEYESKKDRAILSITDEKEKMTPRQAKWLEQRNRLIAGIRIKLGLEGRETKDLLKSFGVDISETQIKEATINEKKRRAEIAEKPPAHDASVI